MKEEGCPYGIKQKLARHHDEPGTLETKNPHAALMRAYIDISSCKYIKFLFMFQILRDKM